MSDNYRQTATVEDMVVAPQHRGQGIGRRLLQGLERWARAQDLPRLQLGNGLFHLGRESITAGVAEISAAGG